MNAASRVPAIGDDLLHDLPAVFTDPAWASLEPTQPVEGSDYLTRLLGVFSSVFLADPKWKEFHTGESHYQIASNDPLPGRVRLEDRIAALPRLADPRRKTEEFLDWLGTWVALSDRVELSREKKEALIANAMRLYRVRGTKGYLEEMLSFYLDCNATVDEPEYPAVQIGEASTVGRDTYIGGSPAFLFRVTLTAGTGGPEAYEQFLLLAHAVIDLSKPAHTWYELRIDAPAMQIGKHSTVGVDTLLIVHEDMQRIGHA